MAFDFEDDDFGADPVVETLESDEESEFERD